MRALYSLSLLDNPVKTWTGLKKRIQLTPELTDLMERYCAEYGEELGMHTGKDKPSIHELLMKNDEIAMHEKKY